MGLGYCRMVLICWITWFAVITNENVSSRWSAVNYLSNCRVVMLSALLFTSQGVSLFFCQTPCACFAIYFSRNLFSFREHNQKAARSSLLLCKMFSKSVTLHLSPNHKIPCPTLEHCVKAGMPQLDWFIKLKRRHFFDWLWTTAVFLELYCFSPESIGSFCLDP